jgi:peptidoglycan hydrolase-like protein with peptidoglycan-binding domain
MAEVITISGFGRGLGAACPPGWTATGSGNCRGSAAKSLQDALRALGAKIGDSALRNLAADGVVGPATVAAVNRAFTAHVGSGQAPPAYRTGALSLYDVAQLAGTLAQLVSAEVTRRGGSLVAPPAALPPPGAAPGGSSTLWWVLGGLGVAIVLGGVLYTATRR